MSYSKHRYLLKSIDPIHVGTGGNRLGRVDNSIVREPGTKVPKIPGSSLHGAARAYAARKIGEPGSAGQSHNDVANPDQHPVCYTFGYVKDSGNDTQATKAGVLHVFDAHILLFPVYSKLGPLWVTTSRRLTEAGFGVDGVDVEPALNTVYNTGTFTNQDTNLGWMMVRLSNSPATLTLPVGSNWGEDPSWAAISSRIVIVSESLFSHIVNSNLEVRTSVSIDPITGAAVDGALYTYEAIPRATFLTCDIVKDDYRSETDRDATFGNGAEFSSPLDVFNTALAMMAWFGVGGMGTRGFGRVEKVGSQIDFEFEQENI